VLFVPVDCPLITRFSTSFRDRFAFQKAGEAYRARSR
jgi:hypothetical protein